MMNMRLRSLGVLLAAFVGCGLHGIILADDTGRLVAQWDAVHAVANRMPDMSGHGHDAVLHDVTLMQKVEDLVERPCLYFDGRTAHAVIPPSAALNPAHITVSVWFKLEEAGIESQVPLVVKSLPTHEAPWYQYGLFLIDRPDLPRCASFYISAGGASHHVNACDLDIYSGWAQLVASYDGAAMRLYFNGREMARHAVQGNLDAHDTPLYFGAYANLPRSASTCFQGSIATASVFSDALGAEDILRRHEQERPAFPQAAPIAITDASPYAEALNAALHEGRDVWGEALIAQGGATFENIKNYLRPLFFSTGHTNETLGVHNLLFGEDGGAPPYFIPLADGSRIALNVYQAPEFIEWRIGPDASEVYGSALERLRGPSLDGGYYPILCTGYTDAAGTAYEQESFAVRLDGAYRAFIKLTAAPGETPAQAHIHCGGADAASLRASLPGEWRGNTLAMTLPRSSAAPQELYVIWSPAAPIPDTLQPNAALFASAKQQVMAYWDAALARGALFDVPEELVMHAQRNLLIQNLIMRWRYSLGAVVYHASYFQPESSDTVSTLGMFGFVDEYRDGLAALIGLSKGEAYYSNWERGEKLSHGAHYYLLTRDRNFITKHLDAYVAICEALRAQIEADPNGLLLKQRHCGDIPTVAYTVFHQAVCWRGLRDMATVFGKIGRQDLHEQYAPLAARFRASLLDATMRCATELPGGELFIPSMLFNDDPVYTPITETRIGSYWNLCMPYAFSSGLWNPAGPEMPRILRFMHEHGAILLGLLRFNYYPVPIGSWRKAGLPGYYTTGYDNVYLPAYLRMLADADEADRLALSFYGKLAHGQTRGTFVSGEGETVGTRPPEFYRSCYGTPCSANNTAFLLALRLMLLQECFDDNTGLPARLRIAHATPRAWLEDGKSIRITDAPTCFGRVRCIITSQLNQGRIEAALSLPATDTPYAAALRLRTPGKRTITSVQINGAPHAAFDPDSETIDLSGHTGELRVVVTYQTP